MTKKFTQEEFIKKAISIYNDECDYSFVIYINSRIKIIIICKKHNLKYKITPSHHLYTGKGCILCARESTSKALTLNPEGFFKRCNEKHNFYYSYILSIYIRANLKINIICPIHGVFSQTPSNHLNGRGCRKCSHKKLTDSKRLDKSIIIDRANLVHNFKYDYSLILNYTTFDDIFPIICKIHGVFDKTLVNHIVNRQGCPRCTRCISRKEVEWLDYIKVPKEHRNKYIKIGNVKFKPDGFNPDTNTVYEFYGDFWHGNPNKYNSNDINIINNITFGELYEKTMKRENMIKSNNYNFIYIWESDWDKLDK